MLRCSYPGSRQPQSATRSDGPVSVLSGETSASCAQRVELREGSPRIVCPSCGRVILSSGVLGCAGKIDPPPREELLAEVQDRLAMAADEIDELTEARESVLGG